MSNSIDTYASIPHEKAQHLWRLGYGTNVVDGVVTMPELYMLFCPDKDGQEIGILFGAPCLTFTIALRELGVPFDEWVSAGSLCLRFPGSVVKQVKDWLAVNFFERGPWHVLKCDRSSAAAAIRGYRRRRDAIVAEYQAKLRE